MNLRRCIVTIVEGTEYLDIHKAVATNRKQYADFVGAEYKTINLDSIANLEVKHFNIPTKKKLKFIKLLIPAMFTDYDEVAFFDLDGLICPGAPNIFDNFSKLQVGQVGAVQVISHQERQKFLGYYNQNHYETLACRTQIEVPESNDGSRHFFINAGVLIFRPREIHERWSALLKYVDKAYNEEDLLNVFDALSHKIVYLDPKWNTGWHYEKFRKSLIPYTGKKWSPKYFYYKIFNKFFSYCREEKILTKTVQNYYFLHFAFEHKLVKKLKKQFPTL